MATELGTRNIEVVLVLALGSWHKGSNALSVRSLMVD